MTWSMLKGIGGEFEINRVVGAIGAMSYIVTANGMVIYERVFCGVKFDLQTYCLVFPAGFAAVMGAIAGAVALKDRNVAKAIETTNNAPPQQTGAQP